ncbi:hypothetical protein O1Q96_09565 [Streptomyces sp. Qhu-G9]|uniref:hypothetical protein n=1 Tax=Streptomyces sp. Qhu-G9 TaxID=3452799 RepID=UPI0022AC4318|nr:hypothetical protein [Streptomyces aurantiacus]WAU79965.1 hypothetical protein O1Q96_09565 [Streptomyces aurantiacus]
MTTATVPLPAATSRSQLQESLFAWLEPKMALAVPAPETEPEQKTAPPAEPPAAEEEAPDLSHVWVVAAEVEVAPKIASVADYRGSFKAAAGLRVDALEVYCKGCRRPYDEVKGDDCAAKIDNTHLIGGDQTRRAKRKIPTPPPNARIIRGGTINRQGISAYVSGVSRPKR